ncbi:MAG: hypothetical protein WC143_04575 [Eubacteriales bacterium]|jgi:hypothetical protein
MKLTENYSFEAEMATGKVLTEGGDLTGCIRFSLIPNIPNLPRHDFSGIKMERRFCRAFHRYSMVTQQALPGRLTWRDDSDIIISTEDLSNFIDVDSKIAKNATGQEWYEVEQFTKNMIKLKRPYSGKTQQIGGKITIKSKPPEYLHCIVFDNFRTYIKSSDGSIMITSKDYELYL